jgi:hypothetical protein
LSIAPTKGFLTLGRDFGYHYVGMGLHGAAFSSRDGWTLVPGLSYQKRFENPLLPYFGLSASAAWNEDGRGWDTPNALPALGYEWRFTHVYLHVEGFAGTPLDSRVGRKWGLGLGAGIGLPF